MIRLFRNKKKVSIKGRMPGNHLLVPGMYYEKVYSKFFFFPLMLIVYVREMKKKSDKKMKDFLNDK